MSMSMSMSITLLLIVTLFSLALVLLLAFKRDLFTGNAPDTCKPGETYHNGRCYAACSGGATPMGPVCLQKATRHLAFFPCGEGFVKQGNWCTKRATTTPRASYPVDSATPPSPPPSVVFYSNMKR